MLGSGAEDGPLSESSPGPEYHRGTAVDVEEPPDTVGSLADPGGLTVPLALSVGAHEDVHVGVAHVGQRANRTIESCASQKKV